MGARAAGLKSWAGLNRRDYVPEKAGQECIQLFLFLEVIVLRESDFQSSVIKELKIRLPGIIVMKTDPSYKQGIPDLIVLWEDRWATLECKKFKTAHHQPNQDYYVELMDQMSFSSFIYPENRQEVLDDLERFFKEI